MTKRTNYPGGYVLDAETDDGVVRLKLHRPWTDKFTQEGRGTYRIENGAIAFSFDACAWSIMRQLGLDRCK